jgi:putative MATE family efflux protein
VIGRVFNVGLPAGVEQLLMRVGGAVFVKVVASLGTSAVAAHSVAMNVQSMAFMPAFGFGIAATTLVGQALGAERPDRARMAVVETLILCLIMLCVTGAALVLWAPHIIAIFIDDATVIAMGAPCNRILGYCEPIVAVSIVISGVLRGAGDTRFTMLVMAVSMWLVRVPLSFLAAGPLGWGLQGVWIAMAVEMAARAGAYAWRYRSGAWACLRI